MADNDWKKRLGVVYSTDPDFSYEEEKEQEPETLAPSAQRLTVTIDRRNRGGKQVTLVSGFVGTEEDLSELGRKLKVKCGVRKGLPQCRRRPFRTREKAEGEMRSRRFRQKRRNNRSG